MEIFDRKNGEQNFMKKMEKIFVRNLLGISYEGNPRKKCVEIWCEKRETKNG